MKRFLGPVTCIPILILTRRTVAVSGLFALACCTTGCLLPLPCRSPGIPQFSADHSVSAWVHVDYLTPPLDFERSMIQTAYIRWCRTDQPHTVRSKRIAAAGLELGGYQLQSLINIRFSPDSRRLAVVTSDSLQVFDVADGRRWDALSHGECVSSLAWLSNEEIGYAAHTALRGQYQTVTDRTFWRQRVGDPPASRVLIRREEGVDAGFARQLFVSSHWPLEYWSPSGNYVLYKPCRIEGRLHVLDVRAGRAVATGPEELYVEAAAWKDDESLAACIGGNRGRRAALLIDPRSLNTIDFTDPYLHSFQDPPFPSNMAWTHDGRFLLVNELEIGGCVIQPKPFRCIRIGDRLPSRENEDHPRYRYWSHIFPSPIPGWIMARGPDLEAYLADYEGQTILPLGRILGTWSEDGRLAGLVGNDGGLRLQHVVLPATSRPADSPTSAVVPSH